MADCEIFELGDVALRSGITLRQAKIAYKTYGKLAPSRNNVIVMPTYYSGQHADNEAMIGPGRALDPARYFIIVPNMFGNGLSSSPSNSPPPLDRAAFPEVSLYDNVTCQHRLVTEHLGIDRIKLVVGYSMGAQQAFQWATCTPTWLKPSRRSAVQLAPRRTITCSSKVSRPHCSLMVHLKTGGTKLRR
jgi:homoserine O-acetyltransferase